MSRESHSVSLGSELLAHESEQLIAELRQQNAALQIKNDELNQRLRLAPQPLNSAGEGRSMPALCLLALLAESMNILLAPPALLLCCCHCHSLD